MGKRAKFTFKQRLNVVNNILSNNSSIHYEAKLLNVDRKTIRTWITNYKAFGIKGLMNTTKRLLYPIELKIAAVREYLLGEFSLLNICQKYKIRGTKQLRSWISLYNKGKLLESGGLDLMKIKGVRKNLTLEDRVEVVKHYLEISRDYSETAIKFEVSYQQVYQWVQKYNKFGVDGLIDRRGKRKAEDELTEVEKLKLNIKLLEAKNRRIELENAFLKKLNELEGV